MLETCGVIMLSCSYSGIFKGTDMLMELQDRINNIMNKTGRFIMMILLGHSDFDRILQSDYSGDPVQ